MFCASKLLLFIALLTTAGFSKAQRQIISPAKYKILYTGVYNVLEIMLEGCPCDELVVIPENGAITPRGCGLYNYRADTPGKTSFYLTCTKGSNRDTVRSGYYQVQYPPLPVADINNSVGSHIDSKRLCDGKRIGLRNKDFYYDAYYRVLRYDITLLYGKDARSITLANEGEAFTNEISALLCTAVPGDIVMVRNIQVVGPGDVQSEIAPIIFDVK